MIAKLKGATIVMAVLVLFLVTFLITCSKDEPEIVGCSSIKYKGETYKYIECEPGVLSFNVSINDGPCFHVECSGGCISSVSLCGESGSLSKSVVGPED